MNYFRITKFDPAKRNEWGHYLDKSEWTAISDIGKPEYNNVNYEAYEKIESAYVKSIIMILEDRKINTLIADSVHQFHTKEEFEGFKTDGRLKNMDVDFDNDIKIIEDGMTFQAGYIGKIIRLILRETIHLKLVNSEIEIKFGYDYYMYVKCENLMESTISNIESMGLFVEPDMG